MAQFIRVISAISAPFGLKVCDSRSASMDTDGGDPVPIDSTHGHDQHRAVAGRVDLACRTCRGANTAHPHVPPTHSPPTGSYQCALQVPRWLGVLAWGTDRARRSAIRRSSTASGSHRPEKTHGDWTTDQISNVPERCRINETNILTCLTCYLYYFTHGIRSGRP